MKIAYKFKIDDRVKAGPPARSVAGTVIARLRNPMPAQDRNHNNLYVVDFDDSFSLDTPDGCSMFWCGCRLVFSEAYLETA